MLTHLPPDSDFSLGSAVAHFTGFRRGRSAVRAELATSVSSLTPTGFRVWFGSWSVVSWLEEGAEVLADSAELAAGAGPAGPRPK